MSGVTNSQSRGSPDFIPTVSVRTLAKRTVNFRSTQRLAMSQDPVSDLSVSYPDKVVASSQSLGWQNLRALEMLHTTPEWTMPPLENHCIIVHI